LCVLLFFSHISSLLLLVFLRLLLRSSSIPMLSTRESDCNLGSVVAGQNQKVKSF
jgi:hypothetical protein